MLGRDRFIKLGDTERHLIELPQEVIGKLDVSLVDFIDEEHDLFIRLEGLPKHTHLDVRPDVRHVSPCIIWKARVVESLNHVIRIEPLSPKSSTSRASQ